MTTRYQYWKKQSSRIYEHIPTGNTIKIHNEPEMDYQGIKCYLITLWIQIGDESEATHFNIEFANGYQDALYILKEFLDDNDSEVFDYNKFYKTGQLYPGADKTLWGLVRDSPSYKAPIKNNMET